MMTTTTKHAASVALLLDGAEEARLWGGMLEMHGLPARPVPAVEGLDALLDEPVLARARIAIADGPMLLAQGIAPAALAARMRERLPEAALFVRLPARTGISRGEQAWAHAAGIASLLPGSTVAAWRESVVPVLGRVLEHAGLAVEEARLEAWLNKLVRSGAEPRPGAVKDAYADVYSLEAEGIVPARLFEAMHDSAIALVADRTWRGKSYRACFVASEALDWLVARFGLRRAVALKACTFLWRTGRIHHVVRDAAFADDHLFFRLGARRSELEPLDLARVAAAMHAPDGVARAERVHHGRAYPDTFVGGEAVDWLATRYAVGVGAAEDTGQRLLELGVFHHVADEHGFVDGRYFYRFRADEAAPAAAAGKSGIMEA